MAALFSAPPEGAMTTPRFTFQQSIIPRPASSKEKADAASSPKSVITDMRFVSPGSSSSSSKCQPRGLDRSYSTSDGEFSDPDSVLDSTGTSRELGKQSGHSGPLESLPETHSLALEVTNASVPAGAEMPKTLTTSSKRGDGEPTCRIPLFPAVNGLESTSEPTALFVLADRTSDSGRGQHGATLHSLAALRNDKNYEDRATTARANSKALPTSASKVSAAGDQVREPNSQWSRTATSSESAFKQDEKVSSSSSARRKTASESGSTRRRDPSSRPTFSAELSSTGMPLERGDDSKRRSVGPGAEANFGYSGTPLRFFPGFNTHAYSPSPRVQKAAGTYTLTPSSSDVGPRHQHRFLSGPIMGSMIPKPPPSKWDDADKWIVSPGRKQSPTQPHPRSLQTLLTGRRHSIAGGHIVRSHHGVGSPDYSTPPGEKPMSPQFEHAFVNAGKIEFPKRSSSQKKRSKALSFSDLSRKTDASRASGKSSAQNQDRVVKEANGQRGQASVPSSTDTQTNLFIVNDKSIELNERPLLTHNIDEKRQEAQHPVDEPETADSTMNASSANSKGSRVSKHSRSVSMQELSFVSVAAEPVSLQEPTNCRDIGTQITPVETPENSTCTTPGLTASPTRHNNAPAGIRAYSLGAIPVAVDSLELQTRHMEKLELRNLAGDDQPSLDRSNIWTTREEEEMESAASLREDPEDLERFQLAAKATSWEEAEQTKALVRFRNKEAKIKAWEQHQKAQAEAEMKKIEAKVEKILAGASEKMKERLASASKKAAEMSAAAEVARNQQAAKIAVRAELMRKASLLSTSKTSFKCCFPVFRG